MTAEGEKSASRHQGFEHSPGEIAFSLAESGSPEIGDSGRDMLKGRDSRLKVVGRLPDIRKDADVGFFQGPEPLCELFMFISSRGLSGAVGCGAAGDDEGVCEASSMKERLFFGLLEAICQSVGIASGVGGPRRGDGHGVCEDRVEALAKQQVFLFLTTTGKEEPRLDDLSPAGPCELEVSVESTDEGDEASAGGSFLERRVVGVSFSFENDRESREGYFKEAVDDAFS